MFERTGFLPALASGAVLGGGAVGFTLGAATGSVAAGMAGGLVGLVAGGISGPGIARELRERFGAAGKLSRLLAGRPPLLPHNGFEVGKTLSVSPTGDATTSIHYFEFGAEYANQGTSVLIHGLQSHSYEWANFLPLFATDETGSVNRHVLVMDLPGFGYSGFLPGHDYRFSGNLGKVLTAFLREKTKQPVTLIANSLGTAVSLTLASLHPGLVKELILFSPLAPIGPEAKIPPPIQIMARKKEAGRVGERLSDRMQKTLFRFLLWHFLHETAEDVSQRAMDESASPYLYSAVGRERVQEMFRARAGWCQAIIDYLRNPEPFAVAAIDQSTLLVYGEGDRVFTPQSREAAMQLADTLAHGTFLSVSPRQTTPWPAGHALPTTNPGVAAQIVREAIT